MRTATIPSFSLNRRHTQWQTHSVVSKRVAARSFAKPASSSTPLNKPATPQVESERLQRSVKRRDGILSPARTLRLCSNFPIFAE